MLAVSLSPLQVPVVVCILSPRRGPQIPQSSAKAGEMFFKESISTTQLGRTVCITKRILSWGMATQPPV